jgi:predicted CXXCH cytochrome family protein
MTAKSADRKTTIVNPAALTDAGKSFSVCGRCHGSYTVGGGACAVGFQPGQDLLQTPGFALTAPVAGQKMAQLNELRQSKHFAQGVTCLKCHSAHPETALPHQVRKPVVELCTECHQDKAMATHAPNAAAGATCATCHMPAGKHSFAKPTP